MIMKKVYLQQLLLLAVCSTMNAQTDNGFSVIPSPDDDESIMYTISPNGKYAGGYSLVKKKAVVYDITNKQLKTFGDENAEGTGDVRNISDDGKFQFLVSDDFGNVSYFYSFAENTPLVSYDDGSLAKGVARGGDMVVGAMMHEDGAYWSACYWNGTDNTPVYLPEPSDKWSGWTSLDETDPTVVNGTSADFVSADKSVIAGYVIDNFSSYPAVLWRLNKDGKTYSLDFISRRYFDNDYDGRKPYVLFTPAGLSENGKWLALTIATSPDGWAFNYGIARYNVEEDELETFIYSEEDGIEEANASAISNDGTIIGFSGGFQAEKGIIWKAGEAKPAYLAEEYPGVPQFAEYDENGGHMPGCISADGRYIVGFGYYYRDGGTPEDDSDDTAGYESYVFDTQNKNAATAIAAAPTASKKSADNTVVARYDMTGKRIQARVPGINIMKMRTGKAVKAVNK